MQEQTKKIKLLKETAHHNKWTVHVTSKDYTILVHLPIEQLVKLWYAEYVEEKPTPEFRVWDYVVSEIFGRNNLYFQISNVQYSDTSKCYGYDWYCSWRIRRPTLEELDLFFK